MHYILITSHVVSRPLHYKTQNHPRKLTFWYCASWYLSSHSLWNHWLWVSVTTREMGSRPRSDLRAASGPDIKIDVRAPFVLWLRVQTMQTFCKQRCYLKHVGTGLNCALLANWRAACALAMTPWPVSWTSSPSKAGSLTGHPQRKTSQNETSTWQRTETCASLPDLCLWRGSTSANLTWQTGKYFGVEHQRLRAFLLFSMDHPCNLNVHMW